MIINYIQTSQKKEIILSVYIIHLSGTDFHSSLGISMFLAALQTLLESL